MVQNKATRLAARAKIGRLRGQGENPVSESTHEILNLEPMNVRLHNLAEKIWNKLRDLEPETIQLGEEAQQQTV